ncbi:ras di-ras and rheb family members of small gtpase superfamily [Anaeramoeba flamelloides]|uniref:Ras di-ras and rheb family members of small gtpase superfamily n=1 Tax=Anaeramoeba flamelloides TaxID=1746091 RepID=A0AAV7ZLY5_9EUKA|nr:ras di-ras and rheb family members of small gtpase superfamily [Anaeramoeba flamelloides]
MSLLNNIILVGDKGVGKSSLKDRLDTDLLYDLDQEIENTSSQFSEMNDQDLFLGILELLHQESIGGLVEKYYSESEYFLFMYSVDSPDSFLKMKELYKKITSLQFRGDFKMVLMANKIDLDEKSKRSVSKKKGRSLARTMDCPYYEVSVKTGENLDSAFVDMIHHFIISTEKQKHSDIVEDFKMLFLRQELTDCSFATKSGKKVKAHRLILESRLSPCTLHEIGELLLRVSHYNAVHFLKWVYTGYVHAPKVPIITSMCQKLSLEFKDLSGVSSILKNLRNLYSKNSSKDFTIIVDKKRIKVHKLILVARSELFRGFFLSMDKTTKSVKDYSRNSIDTMKSLIKFFYTNTWNLKNKKNFIQEIENSIEYFQLNINSSLSSQLSTLKKNKFCKIM